MQFSIKKQRFLLYLGAQISKIFRPSAGQIPIFVFSDTNNPDFFLPDTNNLLTTPPHPRGVWEILLKAKCFIFYQYLGTYGFNQMLFMVKKSRYVHNEKI